MKITLATFSVIFLLQIPLQVVSQNNVNVTAINKSTFEYYSKGEWKKLIETGKVAKKHNIDFYYLNVRLGVAYFNTGKYRKAVYYFRKAYKSDPDNVFVKKYLYLSFLYSGRTEDAKKFEKNLKPETLSELKILRKTDIYLTADTRFENNKNYKHNTNEGEFLSQSVRNGYNYFSSGLKALRFQNSLYFNFANINKSSIVYFPEYDSINYIYRQIKDKFTVNQKQFYINYSNRIFYGLGVTMAFNWIHLNSRFDSVSFNKKTNSYAGVVAINKDAGDFKFELFTSISNLNNGNQIQPGIDLIWYPFSNDNIYFSTLFSYKFENNTDTSYNEPLIKPAIGFRIKNFYFEPSYSFGKIKNFTEYDGLVINNDIDVIKNRFDFLTYAFFMKNKIYVFFKYQSYNKENIYFVNTDKMTLTYKNNTFTFGVQFKF